MTVVIALVSDAECRVRISEAVRRRVVVHFCDRHDDLLALVRRHPGAVVIAELRDRRNASNAASIRSLRDGFPSVPVLAYCTARRIESRDILESVRAGASDLLIRGVDDVGAALRCAIEAAEEQSIATQLWSALAADVPSGLRAFVHHCLTITVPWHTVGEVARALHVNRKTLVNRCAMARWPAPGAVISWCRLALAARLLEDPERRVDHVALQLDFPSGTALRNMLRRYTGLRALEVRERGGANCVLKMFRSTLPVVAQRNDDAPTVPITNSRAISPREVLPLPPA